MATQTWIQAADRGDAQTLEALLAEGADVNAQTASGETALMRAASNGRTETVRFLLDKGADVNLERHDGLTALALAAFFGHADIVCALLVRGANVRVKNGPDSTPLKWALSRGYSEIARLLKIAEATADNAPPPAPEQTEHLSAQIKAGEPPHRSVDVELSEPVASTAALDRAASPDGATLNTATQSVNGLTVEKAAVAEADPCERAGKTLPDRGRWHKRSASIRKRIREGERKKASAATRVSPVLPVIPSTPPQTAKANTTRAPSSGEAVLFNRNRRWGTNPFVKKAWLGVAALLMLCMSGISLYKLIQDINQPSRSGPAHPVPTNYGRPPVLLTMQPSAQKSPENAQSDSALKLPESPAERPNLTSAPSAILDTNANQYAAPRWPPPGAEIPHSAEPVVVSLAQQDDTKRETREEKPKPPSNSTEQRDEVKLRLVPSPTETTPYDSLSSASSPAMSTPPKKKVIEWP